MESRVWGTSKGLKLHVKGQSTNFEYAFLALEHVISNKRDLAPLTLKCAKQSD